MGVLLDIKGAWSLSVDLIDGREHIVVGYGFGGRAACGVAAGRGDAGEALREMFAAGMFDELRIMRDVCEDAVEPGDLDGADYGIRPSADALMLLTGRASVVWREKARNRAADQRDVRRMLIAPDVGTGDACFA